MGAEFAGLDPEVQALHRHVGPHHGEITVRTWPPLRLLGFPPSQEVARLTFSAQEAEGRAIWSRLIGGVLLRSEFTGGAGRVTERMGAMTVTCALQEEGGALRQLPVAMRFFDLPLPRALWLQVRTREWGDAGRYHFSVDVRAPVFGLALLAYEGWLAPDFNTAPK